MSPESVLRSRRDISWQLLNASPLGGLRWWSAFDPIARTNYRCGETEAWLFKQFDGHRSLRAIQAECVKQTGQGIPLDDLIGLARMLCARGLVRCSDEFSNSLAGAPLKTSATGAWLRTLNNTVSWRLRGVNPDRWLRWLAPHTDWLLSAKAVRVWSGLAALVALLVMADYARLAEQATLWQWLMRPSSGGCLFAIFIVTRGLHELGHALVLTRYGGRCPDIGLIFMLGAPCVYCDVTESWRLPGAWQRAAVAAGGMYIEVVVAALAGILWLSTTDGLVNTLALQTMVVCSVSTVLINANPLMRFDGYYILSDVLDEPNLRARADQCSMAIAKRCLIGNRPERALASFGRTRWLGLAAFGFMGLVYRLSLSLMMVAVVIALYAAWELVWIGRLMALVLFVSWWVLPTMKLGSTLIRSATDWSSRVRLATFAAAVVLIICGLPLPSREYAIGWIQPERLQGLYAPTTARLERVLRRSGDTVRAGEPVFVLAQDQPKLRAIEMSHVAQKAQARLVSLERQRYYMQDIDLTALQTTAETAQQQAEHARQAVARQTVTCALDGRLMSLPATKLLDIDSRPIADKAQLWLDEKQVGRYVPAGAMLGAVCSEEQLAVLPLDDQQLHCVCAGTPVKIYVPAQGTEVWSTKVSAVVRLEQLDSAARLLAETGEQQGTSATAAQSPTASLAAATVAGRASAGYAAVVQLPEGGAHVNAQVKAAFVVPSKTLAHRAVDWISLNGRWLSQ